MCYMNENILYSILFVEHIQTLHKLRYRIIYIYIYTLKPMLAFQIKLYIIILKRKRHSEIFATIKYDGSRPIAV